jgi:hypothetical protein
MAVIPLATWQKMSYVLGLFVFASGGLWATYTRFIQKT